ncbi:MAG: bifunctional DNA primase/polymerase, partial [Acidobacteriaceae bacterium]
GDSGKASLKALTAAHGALPETICAMTGRKGSDGTRKGCHYYFRAPLGVPIRNSAGILGKGLDIRADGGYVVAPPSLHPSGLLYKWLVPEQPLAEVPTWMLTKLSEAKPASAPQQMQDAAIGEGGRNAALTSLAGTMRRRGMEPEAIEAALLKENETRCQPPLAASEVRNIASSVARYQPAAPVRAIDQPTQAVTRPPLRQWPAPLEEAAYYGLAGEVVRLLEPHTEADPAALLFQFFAAIGSIIGRGPHYSVGAVRHYTNLFVVIVGNSSTGVKGTSWSEIQRVCEMTDLAWRKTRITSGLSTGEGLIHAVRDEITESVPIKEKGRVIDREDQVTDPGEKDKRLLCKEGELAQALQCAGREGNTLSAVIRQAWDGDTLRVLAKNAKASCAEPHISIIGHITPGEVQRLLTASDAANGFANRFLWVMSVWSKPLPFGGTPDMEELSFRCGRLREAVVFARTEQEVAWASDAARLWEELYPQLRAGKPGVLGSITARAVAQIARLALLYALLDKSGEIRLEHLRAALELWRYAADSAAYIFGQALGDPTADAIVELLRTKPDGVTRTELSTHFDRNKSKAQLDAAITLAQESGLLHIERRETGGRAAEVLRLVSM